MWLKKTVHNLHGDILAWGRSEKMHVALYFEYFKNRRDASQKLGYKILLNFILKELKYWGTSIFDALRDLVTFVQFKKREKRPWRSIFLIKSNAVPYVFFTLFK